MIPAKNSATQINVDFHSLKKLRVTYDKLAQQIVMIATAPAKMLFDAVPRYQPKVCQRSALRRTHSRQTLMPKNISRPSLWSLTATRNGKAKVAEIKAWLSLKVNPWTNTAA